MRHEGRLEQVGSWAILILHLVELVLAGLVSPTLAWQFLNYL